MAQFAGKGGKVTIAAATVGEIDQWDLSINQELYEITKFLDAAKGFLPGVYEWNGKFSGRYDSTDAQQLALLNALLAGTLIVPHLYIDATKNWTGNAYLKSINPKATVLGLVTADFVFQGTGALAFT
jgi:hypothetical protein